MEKWESKENGSIMNTIKAYETLLKDDLYKSPLSFDLFTNIRLKFIN